MNLIWFIFYKFQPSVNADGRQSVDCYIVFALCRSHISAVNQIEWYYHTTNTEQNQTKRTITHISTMVASKSRLKKLLIY